MKKLIIISAFLLATTASANTHTTMINVQEQIDLATVVLIGSYTSIIQSESFESTLGGDCQEEVTIPDGPTALVKVDCPEKSYAYTIHFKTVEGVKGDANGFDGRSPGGSVTETGSDIQITLTDEATANGFVDKPFSVLFLTKTFVDRGNSDPMLAPPTDWNILNSAGAYNFNTLEEAQAFLRGTPSEPTDVNPDSTTIPPINSNNSADSDSDNPTESDSPVATSEVTPVTTSNVTPANNWLQQLWQWFTSPLGWL